MATSAISGRIVFKQGPRAYLESNIRSNSLVFDTDNHMILYSPSGTNYYEFPSGNTSGGTVSGDVSWENVINQPIASNSTSGLLSVSDWNIFNNKVDVSALSGIGSGSGTVSSVGISSNSFVVTNSPITSSGTFSVELSSVVVSGVSTKVSYDEFGRVISGGSLVSADIPTLPTNKIITDSSNRFVSDVQINSWTSASTSAHTHTNKSTLDNINQNLNTSSSVSFVSVSSTNFNDTNFSGDKVLVSDISKNIIESIITPTQLNYLSGTSANIQNQINNKADSVLIIPSYMLVREIYNSTHLGTLSLTAKDVLTQFSSYTITSADAQMWLNYRKILRDDFMFGVNWANINNTINFICTWNGVVVVDNVYVRPNISGAPTFASGQNRILSFINDFRIQANAGNTVYPRNHAKWFTNYGGTVNFGSCEEYSWGQNSVDITNGVSVVWSYYIQGTGSPTLYFDNHRAIL